MLGTGQEALWRSTWYVEAARSRVLDVSLVPVLTGLERPVAIVDPEDGSAGFLIAEQGGRVVWARPNVPEHQLVLDLTDEISCCGERGLIGLTVHPDFRNDPRIYVHYTDAENDTVVAEYTGRPGEVDPASARILLRVEQPDVTHNGGQLAFGPDGLLYVALGDGGFGVSPRWTAQDPDSRLGKVLRLDPDAPAAVETVALGLRNPWRFSFDRETGDLWIADVGQAQYEEVNLIPAGARGLNFGWPVLEGERCRNTGWECDDPALTAPVLTYDHKQGCSVTGGYVYRGSLLPDLYGHYLYADFCSGRIWAAHPTDTGFRSFLLFHADLNPTTFGQDQQGELYVTDYGMGAVYQLVPHTVVAQAE